MSEALIAAAIRYRNAGLSAISAEMPAKKPGPFWSTYQTEQMSESELIRNVKRQGGVGIVTGYGGYEAIDFDMEGHSWPAFRDAVSKEMPEIFSKVYIEKSISGGRHLVFTSEHPGTSDKLTTYQFAADALGIFTDTRHGARIDYEVFEDGGVKHIRLVGHKKAYKVKDNKGSFCAIETRGVGGFLVVAPTAGYEAVVGDLAGVKPLTGAERRLLIDVAKRLGDSEKGTLTPVTNIVSSDDHDFRIGTWYAKHGDHKEFLEHHQWTFDGVKGTNEQWVRPGKDRGVSATWEVDKRVFYVFTSSTELKEGTGYSLYALKAEFDHDGDFKKASKALEKAYPDVVKELKKLEKAAAGVAAGPEVVALVQRDAGRVITEIHEQQLRVLLAIRRHMVAGAMTFNALGMIQQDGVLSSHSTLSFANEIAFGLRNDKTISTSCVEDVVNKLQHDDSIRRRQEIVGKIIGKPASKAGELELEKFLNAVSPAWTQADKIALMHLMWNTKSLQANKRGSRQMLVCLFSPTQDAGKSEAAKKFISPWEELGIPKFEAKILVDEKRTKVLSQLAIANIDEMAGMAKADLEELKSKITADMVNYRPMRTNDFVPIPMRMSFIATSNRPLAEIVRDNTGIRRFYEIKTRDVLDWSAINTIDYALLWSAVSEQDEAPGAINRSVLAEAQRGMAYDDSVGRWLEEEDFCNALGERHNPDEGIKTADMYQCYNLWCQRFNERPLTGEYFGRRLLGMGWERIRTRGELSIRSYKYRRICDV